MLKVTEINIWSNSMSNILLRHKRT